MNPNLVVLLLLVGGGLGLSAGGPPGPGASRLIHVRDFGAVPDGAFDSGDALRAAIAAAIASGPGTEVILEAGNYRVGAGGALGSSLPIVHATNLTVRGAGASTHIVLTDPAAGGFGVAASQQVTLQELSIDYDPPPFTQGTIRAVSTEGGFFDLRVDEGYPTPDAANFVRAIEPYGKWGMIMDREQRRIRSGTPDHYMTPRWEARGDRVWRFFTPDAHHRQNLAHMRRGDAYVHLARGHGSAVFAQGCDGIRLERLTVHASPGLAVGLVGNRGEVVVRGLEVRFPTGSSRLLTANADGVHGQQNRSGPVIEGCYFEGMADDAINLYTVPHVLREVRTPSQWLVSPGATILPGDRFQVLDPRTGRLRGEVRAVRVDPESRGILLTIDRPVEGATSGQDHRSADTLYNLDGCGAGFRIRGNRMNGNRRYGCLLRAGDGVVEDNTFTDTTGAGVVLTNEPDWPEEPVPWGVTVRRNQFIRGGTCLGYADSPQGAALVLRATRLGHGLAGGESLAGVAIEDNTFTDSGGTAVYVGGGTNIALRSNRITASLRSQRWRTGPAILLEASSGVVLSDNLVSDLRSATSAAVEIAATVAAGDAGVRMSRLSTELSLASPPVIDRRGR